MASPGAATSAKEAIPRRTGLGVKTEASAQAIDCLQEESDKQMDCADCQGKVKLFLPLLC